MGNNLRDSGLLDVNDHPCGPVEWMERARESERAKGGERERESERAEGEVTLWGSKMKETQTFHFRRLDILRGLMIFQLSLVSEEFIQPLC